MRKSKSIERVVNCAWEGNPSPIHVNYTTLVMMHLCNVHKVINGARLVESLLSGWSHHACSKCGIEIEA